MEDLKLVVLGIGHEERVALGKICRRGRCPQLRALVAARGPLLDGPRNPRGDENRISLNDARLEAVEPNARVRLRGARGGMRVLGAVLEGRNVARRRRCVLVGRSEVELDGPAGRGQLGEVPDLVQDRIHDDVGENTVGWLEM